MASKPLRCSPAMRGVIHYARDHGWHVTRTRGGHLQLTKQGCPCIFTASTPSDYRAARNVLSRLRREDRNHG